MKASDDLIHRRLHEQRLRGTPWATPLDVVRGLAAMQAQEFAYARWSIAQRAKNATGADVDRLFADGAILRTHVLRPTWHFVAADDIRWLLTVSAPRVHKLNAYYYRQSGVDAAVSRRSQRRLAQALAKGRHLTRTEIASLFQRDRLPSSGVALAYVLIRAELDAVICSGPMRGKQHTYALLDERASGARTLSADEALVELTRRYFTTRGPATVKDYATWASLSLADARQGLEGAGASLTKDVIDGRTFWLAPSRRRSPSKTPVIDLVQCYDEYVLSYSESRDVLRSAEPTRPPRPGTAFMHTILLDGRIIGHWRRTFERGAATVETQWYRRLARDDDAAFERALERYGRFEGMPAKRR